MHTERPADEAKPIYRADRNEETGAIFVKPFGGQIIAELDPSPDAWDIARRIAAALNIARGTSTDALEKSADSGQLEPITIAYVGIGVVAGLHGMPNAIMERIIDHHQGQLGVVQAALDDAAAHGIDSQECDGVHPYEVAEQFGIDFVHTEAERICGKERGGMTAPTEAGAACPVCLGYCGDKGPTCSERHAAKSKPSIQPPDESPAGEYIGPDGQTYTFNYGAVCARDAREYAAAARDSK